jgi:uncharacterized protein (TIGR02118 family)
MAGVRLLVIYPRPKDIGVFERAYTGNHLPMAAEKIPAKTKFVVAKVLGTPEGEESPFYRIAELHFPSLEALHEAASSQGAQEAIADAVALSTGGAPIFLIAEEEKPVPF